MKKFLASLFLTSLIALPTQAYLTDDDCEHPFDDVEGHSADEAICELYSNNVVDGFSERSFSPSAKITRAEFLKVALINMGYVVSAKSNHAFDDSDSGDWHYKYTSYAASKGLVSGDGHGNFLPNDEISRAEALSILTNMAGISTTDTSGVINRFKDVSGSDWYAKVVAVAIKYDLVEGYGDNTFRPDSSLTRAEAAILAVDFWDEFGS